jgi:hypothetical protein
MLANFRGSINIRILYTSSNKSASLHKKPDTSTFMYLPEVPENSVQRIYVHPQLLSVLTYEYCIDTVGI